MTAYRRDFDETKYMYFLIKHDKVLEKFDAVWEKVRKIIKE